MSKHRPQSPQRVRKHVWYSGQVQGVGFRYTALRLAQHYDVAGYVRNLRDGRVELVAEGQTEEVEAFLQAVAQAMIGYIVHQEITVEDPEGLPDFRIAY
ncbi:MAG: acylphosphatase [Gemmatales bacterium]|nr:acylphosphatase [Gemmatales bacterium]MDW8221517.1 acylphosphatase [Gemmatales bacterium]